MKRLKNKKKNLKNFKEFGSFLTKKKIDIIPANLVKKTTNKITNIYEV